MREGHERRCIFEIYIQFSAISFSVNLTIVSSWYLPCNVNFPKKQSRGDFNGSKCGKFENYVQHACQVNILLLPFKVGNRVTYQTSSR